VPAALGVFVYTSQRFLAEMIRLTLDHGVFVTRTGHRAIDAATIVRDWRPQLIVVDLESVGSELLLQTGPDRAAARIPVPIIAVTRNHEPRTFLGAFDRGVDDVMTVPFSPDELLARVYAMARRTYGVTLAVKPIVLQDQIEIDIVNHHVRVGASDVRLSTSEQSLLYLLASNVGEVVTTDEILLAVLGAEFETENDLVERLIARLRAKLQVAWSTPQFIENYPGGGYRFLPEVEQQLTRA